ncbi:hypothetical protein HK101_007867, partial [Irineochytrium annulatum]
DGPAEQREVGAGEESGEAGNCTVWDWARVDQETGLKEAIASVIGRASVNVDFGSGGEATDWQHEEGTGAGACRDEEGY